VRNVLVERDHPVRGYEFAKDQYVRFTEAEQETSRNRGQQKDRPKEVYSAVLD
jgi:non-homologous end joining protein Ku